MYPSGVGGTFIISSSVSLPVSVYVIMNQPEKMTSPPPPPFPSPCRIPRALISASPFWAPARPSQLRIRPRDLSLTVFHPDRQSLLRCWPPSTSKDVKGKPTIPRTDIYLRIFVVYENGSLLTAVAPTHL